MPLEAGQQLLHYRLIEKIGQGGMGVVWEAEDTKLHRHIALKVLPEAMAADPERRARFEREARAVAALNHPNIVTLHSVEEASTPAGSLHFITMELVEGQTLSRLLPASGLPLGRLLEIAIPLADAVSRAHRAGITHRDLKPDNIMVTGGTGGDRPTGLSPGLSPSSVKVLDFGLAKLQEPAGETSDTQMATVTSDSAAGRVLGTAAYMSPEQAEGNPVDARSDVFSLGTILYEMACGMRPFRGDTVMSTIGSILKEEPSSITELKPSLPRHAGRIIRRCLAKDPERRYQTALDLRNELEELRSEIDSGEPAGATRTTSSAPRRGPVLLLLGAAVTIVVALAAFTMLDTRETPEPKRYVSRPITATSAWDTSPSWSPDGKFIAFERKVSGHMDIYVKPLDGGEAFFRAGGPGDQICPSWTPDGRYLAYVSKQEPGSWVYLVPSDGGTPRKMIATNLLALDFSTRPLGDRPWSDDGSSLLVTKVAESGQLTVYRVDRATTKAEQVTFPPAGADDSNATYSFDGKTILFRREVAGRIDLMAMPAAGGEPEILLENEPDLEDAAWRPDNRHVVFQSRREGAEANTFALDVVTRKVEQLTFGTNRTQTISVSADDRIAYTPFWHDQFLFRVDVEMGRREQITSHAGNNRNARISPDGRTVAYDSSRTGNYEIWLHDLDDASETRFTDNEGDDMEPEWSPDGRRIVFASDREGGVLELFVANADGGTEARRLTEQPLNWNQRGVIKASPLSQWSPDGESIAFRVIGDAGPELWTVDPDGLGGRKRLDEVIGFDWYLDGRRGLITRPRGTESELLAVDLQTGEERSLFVGAFQEIDVAPDGSSVAFCYGRGHLAMGLAILRLEASSDPDGLPRAVGEPEYVVPTEGTWHVHNGGWSPDSKSLVYTRDQDYGSIYELVERE